MICSSRFRPRWPLRWTEDDAGASVAVFVDGEPVVDLWGGLRRRGADGSVGARHHRQRLVRHQDDDRPVRADPRRPGRARSGRAGRPVLAGVRRGGQGGRAGTARARAHRRSARLGRAGRPSCTTGRPPRHGWPRRRRSGSRARAAGYHSLTQGFLVGEVVRRITGRSPGRVLRRRGGRTAGRGLPHRAVRRARPPGGATDPAAGHGTATTPRARPVAMHARPRPRRSVSRTGTPWPGAVRRSRPRAVYGNARSVALVQSVMACGGSVARGAAAVAGGLRPARGGAVPRRGPRPGDADAGTAWATGSFGGTYGWGGWGGSLVMIDPDARMTVAYVTNQMRDPARATTGAWRS